MAKRVSSHARWLCHYVMLTGIAGAVAFVATGCGSSSSTTAAKGSSTTAAKNVSGGAAGGGKVIKIMAQSAVGTPSASSPGVFAAAISAADAANAAGAAGPHRHIQIITCNDQQTASGASTCAQQAIADRVVAVVGYTGFTYLEAPILAKAGIPMQNLALALSDLTNKNEYPVNGGADPPEFAAMGYIPKRIGAKRVAIAVVNFPGIVPDVALEKKALALQGLSPVTADVPIQLTETDFSGVVQKLRSANADAVLLNSSGPQVAPILQAAQSVGYSPDWILPIGADSYSILKSAAGLSNKVYLAAVTPVFLPPGAATYPGVNTMRAQMTKYGGSNGSPPNQDESTIFTWYTMQGLINVVSKIKGNVTAATYTAELMQVKHVDAAGLWRWTPSDRFPDTADPDPFVGHVSNGYANYDARIPVLQVFK